MLELWICGGGPCPTKYAYGYWTGPDNDLLCVLDKIEDSDFVEIALSPVSQSRLQAFILFFMKKKRILNKEHTFMESTPANPEKVFCRNCKYFLIPYDCDHPNSRTNNFLELKPNGYQNKKLDVLNKNNDCEWYKKR